MDCIFCKIINNEIPADILYQDEHILTLKDINPQAPHHILIITRKHLPTLMDLKEEKEEILSAIFGQIERLAQEIPEGKDGFRIVVNCKEMGGQLVPHLHFHFLCGRKMGWPPG